MAEFKQIGKELAEVTENYYNRRSDQLSLDDLQPINLEPKDQMLCVTIAAGLAIHNICKQNNIDPIGMAITLQGVFRDTAEKLVRWPTQH